MNIKTGSEALRCFCGLWVVFYTREAWKSSLPLGTGFVMGKSNFWLGGEGIGKVHPIKFFIEIYSKIKLLLWHWVLKCSWVVWAVLLHCRSGLQWPMIIWQVCQCESGFRSHLRAGLDETTGQADTCAKKAVGCGLQVRHRKASN